MAQLKQLHIIYKETMGQCKVKNVSFAMSGLLHKLGQIKRFYRFDEIRSKCNTNAATIFFNIKSRFSKVERQPSVTGEQLKSFLCITVRQRCQPVPLGLRKNK